MSTESTNQSPPLDSVPLHPMVRRFGPWLLKERPCGDFVVDQLDRENLRVRRYGPYKTYAEAEEKWLDLTTEEK